MTLRIERFDETSQVQLIGPLTALLHEAYRPLAEGGLGYLASHQDERTTLKRLKQGESFLAFWGGQLAGTIYLYPPKEDSPCEHYRKPGVYSFGQFAVSPDLQGRGIGEALLKFVEQRARELGATEIAMDTAEGATVLIAMYSRHGYRNVGSVQWSVTNYMSVVMSKPL